MDGITQPTAEHRSGPGCEALHQVEDAHIASTHIHRGCIGNKGAGGGSEDQLANRHDDHAEPEPPEAAAQSHRSHTNAIEDHTKGHHTHRAKALCKFGHPELKEDSRHIDILPLPQRAKSHRVVKSL